VIAVVKNPGAGSVDDDTGNQLELALQNSGLRYELFESENPADAANEAINSGCTHIIACGGDGTVAGAANSILRRGEKNLRLTIVPLGTGNIIATAMGLPADINECVALAARSSTKKVDAGRIGDDYFLLGIGIGATESFVTQASDEAKAKLGRLAYVASLLRSTRDPLFQLRVTADGKETVASAQAVTLANYWGTERVELLKETSADDGVMECVVAKRLKLPHLIRLALRSLIGNLASDDEVQVMRGEQFTIDTKPVLPVQLDGNETNIKTPLKVEVLQQAIEISVLHSVST
jgi:diacylglycerol kinase (ATP)